jgi:lipopolysaccharide transport system ATP-binding protein
MKPAISVENLGKSYRVSHQTQRKGYRTLRESLGSIAAAPLRRLRGAGTDGASTEEFWALKDVSFEVQPGEVLGIIGRNGAGKSTLLKILSRITKPTNGQIAVRGRVGSLLEVGTGFHPELTGRENIYLNGSILGMSRNEIDRQFDAIVEFSGVEKFLDTPVKRYSSGMYVRLAFAVAAHLEPEILLVDEVLAVGDADFQKKCFDKMGAVARGGRTVVLVSHNMHAIASLTGKALLVDSGRLAGFGRTADIVRRYSELHSSLPGGSAAEWTARIQRPISDLIITAARIRLADGSLSNLVSCAEPFSIEIDFEVRGPVSAQIAYRLNSSEDYSTVFTTAHSDEGGQRATRFMPGRYRAISTVPAPLLRPGVYHLLLAANNPNGEAFDLHESSLEFEVAATGSLINHDGRLGTIIPTLPWRVVPDL